MNPDLYLFGLSNRELNSRTPTISELYIIVLAGLISIGKRIQNN